VTYSSLSYLRRFPFDKIKIDRSFVSDIGDADGSSLIVQAIVNMASACRMSTTAEGVETEMQREILRDWVAARCRDIYSVPRSLRPSRGGCFRPRHPTQPDVLYIAIGGNRTTNNRLNRDNLRS